MALSTEDALFWIRLAKERGKAALYGLYSFSKWKDGKPIIESVVLDCFALKGKKEILEKIGERYLREGKQSLFLFDGEDYLLITEFKGKSLDEVEVPNGVELIKDVCFKFTYPNTINHRTGKVSRIIKRFKLERE